jgi:PAS domain S-box-containing protein
MDDDERGRRRREGVLSALVVLLAAAAGAAVMWWAHSWWGDVSAAAAGALLVAAGAGTAFCYRGREAGRLRRLLQSEEALRGSSEVVRTLFDVAQDVVVLVDVDGRILEANEALCAVYHMTAAELRGRVLWDIVDEDTRERRKRWVAEALRSGRPARYDDTARGRLLDCAVSPVGDEQGRFTRCAVFVRDVTDQRRAVQQMAEHRRFIESVVQNASMLICVTDPEGRVVQFNHACERATGFTEREVLGRRLWEVLVPDFRRATVEEWFRDLAPLAGHGFEGEWRRKDGGSLAVAWRTSVLRDEAGKATFVIGSGVDVTHERRTEEDLRAATERLEAIVSAAPVAIIVMDVDRRLVVWNRAAENAFGWRADEALGRTLEDLMAAEHTRIDAILRLVLSGERVVGVEQTRTRKDGSLVQMSISAVPLTASDGSVTGVLGMLVDVTERTRYLDRLSRLSRLHGMLSRVAEAIVRVRDPKTLYETVCRIVVEEGGYRLAWVAESRGAGEVTVLGAAGEDDGQAERAASHVTAHLDEPGMTAGTLRSGRLTVCTDIASDPLVAAWREWARERGYAAAASVPLKNGGRVIGALSLYSAVPGAFDREETDVLERLAADVAFAIEAAAFDKARRQAEGELAALNHELERRVAARTQALESANTELEAFSYSVSHDLRAPLRALDGFSLALAEDYGQCLDETAQDYLARIRAASQRMGRLIDDVLTLSRVARVDMAPDAVDLSALTREAERELREAAPHHEVSLDLPAALPVHGDGPLLAILVRNLLDNAWKFTARTADPAVSVGAEARGDETVYFVRDNGAGFEPAYAGRLFAPFQRLHSPADYPGTGIGLATVRRIVHRHGGRVWAEGAPGRGATVFFTLERGDGCD